jgi:hypothetical protein
LPRKQKRHPQNHLPHPFDHRDRERRLAVDSDDVAEYDQAGLLYAEAGRYNECDVTHGLDG